MGRMSRYTPTMWDRTDSKLVIRYDSTYSEVAPRPAAHASSHQNGGSDEISVTGLSGLLADPQTPTAHKTAHQDGGADEIDVTGLSGRLADPQNVTVRKNSTGSGTSRPRLNFIEGANITVTLADDGVDGETDITIAASGGAPGALTIGSATLDFGAAPGTSSASIDVVTGIAAPDTAWAMLMYAASADHNAEEHALLARYMGLTCYRSAANTLTIQARTDLRVTGTLAVRWAYGA